MKLSIIYIIELHVFLGIINCRLYRFNTNYLFYIFRNKEGYCSYPTIKVIYNVILVPFKVFPCLTIKDTNLLSVDLEKGVWGDLKLQVSNIVCKLFLSEEVDVLPAVGKPAVNWVYILIDAYDPRAFPYQHVYQLQLAWYLRKGRDKYYHRFIVFICPYTHMSKYSFS